MTNDILKKIRFGGVALISVDAHQYDADQKMEGETLEVVMRVEPELEEDTDDMSTFSVNVHVGFRGQAPFKIDARFRAQYGKKEAVEGRALLESFDTIAYPVMTKVSLLVADLTSAMGLLPLIITPEEFLKVAKDCLEENHEG